MTSPSSTSVKIAKVLATSFGFGYAPVAPGTFGALFGSLVYILVSLYTDWPIDAFLLVGIVLCTALGTWACQVLSDEWGHDPSRVVLDEVVGVWIAYLFIPFSWTGVVLGFVLFRFFDILKPLGIRAIDDKMDSAFSVMLDDVLAGVYAAIVVQLVHYFWL